MKNYLSRLVAAVSAAVMLTGIVTVPSFAESVEETGIEVVAAFNDLTIDSGFKIGTSNTVANLSPVAYKDGKSSLAWTLNNGHQIEYHPQKDIDWTQYANVKVRLRASESTQKFNLVFSGPDVVTSGKYSNKTVTATEQWQEFTYPISGLNTAITNSSDGKSVGFILFNCGGWGIEESLYTCGAKIYIDRIWLEKSDAEYNKSGIPLNGADDKVLELVSYNSPATVATMKKTHSASTIKACSTNTRENGNGMFSLITIPAYSTADYKMKTSANIDKTGYNYLNMWVYSPRPQNSGAHIIVNSTMKSMAKTFNWTGWKLISVDVSAITGSITDLKINANGWARSGYKSLVTASTRNLAGNNAALSHDGATFGVERVWLSAKQPEGANTNPQIVSSSPVTPLDTDTIIADYSSEAAIADSKTNNNASNITATSANSHLYSMAARSRTFEGRKVTAETTTGTDGTTTTTYTVPSKTSGVVQTAEFILFNNSEVPLTGFSGDDYINFWIYNPSIKYDQFGNYSEYILAVNQTTDTANSNVHAGIIANFTGWKLISIKLSDIYNKWNTDTKINIIKITTNEWVKEGTTTNADDLTHSFTDEQLANSYETGNTKYNMWIDKFNYFDFERMWISKEKPSETFTDMTNNFDLTDAEITNNTFKIETASGNVGLVKGDARIIKKNTEGASLFDDTATSYDLNSVTAGLTSALNYDTTYYILYPEIYNASGVKFTGRNEYTVKTKAYYIGSITVDRANDSASVAMQGTIPAKYSKATLIAAEYGTDGLMKQVKLAEYSADVPEISVSFDTAPASGSKVKFFLLTDMISITPMQKNEEYTKE